MPYLQAGEWLKTKHFPYILIHTPVPNFTKVIQYFGNEHENTQPN